MSVQVPVQQPVGDGVVLPQTQRPSLLYGPTDPPLVDLTLGELLNLQCLQHGTREGLVIPWTGARWTYNELNHHSRLLAATLLEMGIGLGDRVGIMAGNCEQYAAVFFAATRIGAILVILNNTYTPTEAQYGLDFSGTFVMLRHPDCTQMLTTGI
jgi:long-chain acyl-CoA synthetase